MRGECIMKLFREQVVSPQYTNKKYFSESLRLKIGTAQSVAQNHFYTYGLSEFI